MKFRLIFVVTMFLLTSANPLRAQETIPRALLVEMAKGQLDVLCGSSIFAGCMGFSQSECELLSDSAIKQCLLPLPEKIDLEKLDNAALESCPREVFADAGHTEEKAGMCFDEAMEVDSSSQ